MDVCPQASTSSMLCARGTNWPILELTCNETKSKSQHQNPSMLCLHHDSSHLSQRSNLLSIVLLRTFNFIPSEEKIPGDDSSRNKRDWLVSSARIATPAYLSWASDIIEKSVKSISRFASPTFAYGDCEWFGTDGGGGMNAYTSPPRPKWTEPIVYSRDSRRTPSPWTDQGDLDLESGKYNSLHISVFQSPSANVLHATLFRCVFNSIYLY